LWIDIKSGSELLHFALAELKEEIMITKTGSRSWFFGLALCLILLIPVLAIHAETEESKVFPLQELQEDFSQLRKAVERLHPTMYEFLSQAEFDRLFERRYAELHDGMSLEEAFQIYASLLANVGCLHTNAWMPEGYWSSLSGKLFPIRMKFVKDAVFAVGSYHDSDSLPPGSEILAINGKAITEILKDLKTVISADAYSGFYKNFRLGFRFPLLYSLFFGHPDSFQVSYLLPGAEKPQEANIRPVPTLRVWRNMRDPRRLDLAIKSDIDAAVVTITDFSYYREHEEFFGFIDSTFAEIAQTKIKNLIIDLRLNNGGDPFCAAHLFSYIEHEPVPYFSKRYGRYAKLADPIPLAENRFQGNLYILIDGGCASTTGHLCGLLKYHKIGTLIGEETGATYTCNDAHRSFLLDHTRLQVGIATGTFATAVQGLSKSRGIVPDLCVQQTASDLADGRDTTLEYALSLCRDDRSPKTGLSVNFSWSDVLDHNDTPKRAHKAVQNDILEQHQQIKELIQKLGSEEWQAAMKDLVEVGEEAVPLLLEALYDYSGHRYLPYRAALTLGRFESRRAYEGLLEAFQAPSIQDYVKRGIIQSLGEIGSDEAVQVLILIAKEKSHNSFIRRTAVLTLAHFPTAEIVEVVHQVFQEERKDLGYPCILAWARMGSDTALDRLIAALEDHPDFLAIEEILDVIKEKRPDSLLPLLYMALREDSWYSSKIAAKVLADVGKPAEKKLIEMLQENSAQLRQRAAWVLGEIPSRQAVGPLIGLLKDKNWMVQNEALVALAKIHLDLPMQPLIEKIRAEIPNAQGAVDFLLSSPAKLDNPEFARVISNPDKTPYDYESTVSLPLYPEVHAEEPNIPSPMRDTQRREYVTAVSKDGKYLLFPVTIENGKPYEYAGNGKGKQLAVDAADFPALAATGLHSDEELQKTQTITGRSIAEITVLGRPERSSGEGFMARDEDIISVLRGDNQLVKALGLTHPELARPMLHAWNMVLEQTIAYSAKRRLWADVEYFFYNGNKVLFTEIAGTKGWQDSIFKDEVLGGYHIRLRRDLDADERAQIEAKYENLNSDQKQELIRRLTQIHTSEIEPYYIMRYGFYEGHTDYRADPIAIAFIFGLRSLAEIEAAFPGKLYGVLTSHFTR
jgi:HEAT repeat protein